jgi:hypothetical protein
MGHIDLQGCHQGLADWQSSRCVSECATSKFVEAGKQQQPRRGLPCENLDDVNAVARCFVSIGPASGRFSEATPRRNGAAAPISYILNRTPARNVRPRTS